MTATWDAMVTVGRIIRPHGHRGEVVVAPRRTSATSGFRPGALMWMRERPGRDA